jgi:hypothetical protein
MGDTVCVLAWDHRRVWCDVKRARAPPSGSSVSGSLVSGALTGACS